LLLGSFKVIIVVVIIIMIIIKAICNAQDPLKKAANVLSGSEKM